MPPVLLHRPSAVIVLVLLAVLAGSNPAGAHDLNLTGGTFGTGYTLPLSSLSGLLGFLTIGLWAGQARSQTTWHLPIVALLGAGFASLLNQAGVVIPHTEQGLMVALATIGTLMVLGIRLPLLSPLSVAALVGMFEGYPLTGAMGHRIDVGSWVGFGSAATLAMAGGLGLALVLPNLIAFRLFGAGIALAGVAMLLDKI